MDYRYFLILHMNNMDSWYFDNVNFTPHFVSGIAYGSLDASSSQSGPNFDPFCE